LEISRPGRAPRPTAQHLIPAPGPASHVSERVTRVRWSSSSSRSYSPFLLPKSPRASELRGASARERAASSSPPEGERVREGRELVAAGGRARVGGPRARRCGRARAREGALGDDGERYGGHLGRGRRCGYRLRRSATVVYFIGYRGNPLRVFLSIACV
jgi:hypothetical protein